MDGCGLRLGYRALLLCAVALGLAACSQQQAVGGGERIYSGSCAACHQANGEGIPGLYPSLKGSAVALGDPGALARWVIKGERPAGMPAGRYSAKMPQFGWLHDEDAAALLSFVRSSFGNAAAAVDAPSVALALASSAHE
jgi:mono/diheme cytochrome c family protein